MRKELKRNECLVRLINRKISAECEKFKAEMLANEPAYIFSQAYRIDIILNIYEQLVEKVDKLPKGLLIVLLNTPNLLEWFYNEWLKQEDSFIYELGESMLNTMKKKRRSYLW